MYNEFIVTSVVHELNSISAEATQALRIKALENYMKNVTGEEKELLNLVLSFQINNLGPIKKPKFTSITFEFKPFLPSLEQWFNSKSYEGIPFVLQTLIYYMSSTKTIGVPERNIVKFLDDYVDIYFWLSDNIFIEYSEDENLCSICHSNIKDKDGICSECANQLYKYTEFRDSSFILNVTPNTCKWLVTSGITKFKTEIDRYIVYSEGKDKVCFDLVSPPKAPYQGVLPFIEYQLPIN